MLRAVSVLAVLSVTAPAVEVAAQDCRRNCRSGEKPDANGCCHKTAPRSRRAAVGYVWVAANPERQPVKIDGRWRGKTPALLAVGTGQRTIEVGGRSIAVEVKRGEIANAVFATRPAAGAAKRVEILEKLYFGYRKTAIVPASYAIADAVAATLRDNPGLWIDVQGHTDSREKPIHSIKRAEAVALYLIGKGVASYRLRVAAYGETRPLAPNRDERGYAKNRRVEFVVLR